MCVSEWEKVERKFSSFLIDPLAKKRTSSARALTAAIHQVNMWRGLGKGEKRK
jgi:hypothetical protein